MRRGRLIDALDVPRCADPWLRVSLTASLALLVACAEAPTVQREAPQAPSADATGVAATAAPSVVASHAVSASPEPRPGAAPLDPAQLSTLEAQLREVAAAENAGPPPLPELPERPCAPSFCVRVIDDAADPLRALAKAPLPSGARLEEAPVPVGLPGGKRALRTRIVAPATATQAELSVLAKLAAPHLPPKRELGWGLGVDRDRKPVLESYLLAPAVIDVADVVRSERTQFEGGIEAVTVELGAAGAARFGEVTARLVHRRFAIVSAGRVQSAPIVQSAIPGGRISVSFPTGAEADAFARLLPAKR